MAGIAQLNKTLMKQSLDFLHITDAGEFASTGMQRELQGKLKKMSTIMNPATISITVANTMRYALAPKGHANALKGRTRKTQKAYGSSNLTNFELAKINAKGGKKLPKRNFFDAEQNFIQQHPTILTRSIKANARVTKNGIKVSWAKVRDEMVQKAKENVIKNRFGFKPLSPVTQRSRRAAGIKPTPPLYATGQLVNAIIGRVDT